MLASLESSPFATWVRESVWGWPFWLSVHVIGTAVVIGFVIIVNLRLLGLFETIPYTSLRRLFPVIWVAFAVQVVSGFVLWSTKPTRYVADSAFMSEDIVRRNRLRAAGVLLSHARARGGGLGCERGGFLLRGQIHRPDAAGVVRRSRRGAADRLPRGAPDGLMPPSGGRRRSGLEAHYP